jgi:hypothetical protein
LFRSRKTNVGRQSGWSTSWSRWASDAQEAVHVENGAIIGAARKIAGGPAESLFQPEWSPDGAVGGDVARRVERSLYERANGYSYEAVKIFMQAGSKQPFIVHHIEHCPPDVGAAFIWLKNRDPDRWRDVQNVEHVMGKYIISDRPITPEQWAAERATIIDDAVEEQPADKDVAEKLRQAMKLIYSRREEK